MSEAARDVPWVVLRRRDLEELLERAVQRGREMSGGAEWLTAEQVAELLGVTRETVITYTRREGLPCSYAGKSPMFRRDRVHAWLDERGERRQARSGKARGTLRPITGGKK